MLILYSVDNNKHLPSIWMNDFLNSFFLVTHIFINPALGSSVGVWCLAQGHLGITHAINWHFSKYHNLHHKSKLKKKKMTYLKQG